MLVFFVIGIGGVVVVVYILIIVACIPLKSLIINIQADVGQAASLYVIPSLQHVCLFLGQQFIVAFRSLIPDQILRMHVRHDKQ